ncbi:cardioacceleratory peptide receptor-like isoform X1 [Mercenaria mercenaria]|uniref:cardioacceleratory peptide receptor-like isoform X1 n=1 Tax=Mercenaria mercenaria TaxID=6596 RepID=UPI00234EDA6B|nr:cardioacceleratory peptide receptor-like isoform X1 [Mercenaria mercenaria]
MNFMEYIDGENCTLDIYQNVTYMYPTEMYEYIDFAPFDQAAAVVSFVLFAAIISLNGLVIYVLLFKKQKKSRLFYFVLQLAIADFLVGVFCVLGDGITSAMYGEYHGGDFVCRMWRFSKTMTIIASNNILIGMSVDRFLAIKYPLNVVRLGMCRFLDKAMVLGAWFISLVVASFYIPYSKGVNANASATNPMDQIGECKIEFPDHWWKPYGLTVAMIVYILPTIGITVCYVGICVIIWMKWRSRLKLSEISTNASSDKLQGDKSLNKGLLPKAKVKSIKMTLVVCLAFFISWTPYFVTILMSIYEPNSVDPRYFVVLGSLYPLNSACNPLIFILFNLRLFSCRQKDQPSGQSYEGISTQVTST